MKVVLRSVSGGAGMEGTVENHAFALRFLYSCPSVFHSLGTGLELTV